MEAITLSIPLGKREYKIKVAPEHEALIRQRLDELQQSQLELRQQFPGRDDHDYLAMTLINWVSRTEQQEAPNQEAKAIEEKIIQLAQLLDV